LLFGISQSENYGFLDPAVWISLLCGIIGLIIFVRRQLSLKQPLLEIRAFRYPMFSLGTAIIFIVFMVPISTSIILPIYMQQVMGLTPLVSALVLLPGNIINFATAPLAGRLFDKLGAKKFVIAGFVILIACIFFFTRLSLSTSLAILIVFHCFFSISLNLVLIPIQTNSLNQLPGEYIPHGVGILNTALQIGGAFGSAIFIGLMGAIEKNRHINLTNPDIQQIHSATVSAVDAAFTAALVFMVIGLVLALFLKKEKRPIVGPSLG
jgi:DHA2 family lincomycin resistance protein-like MFS transporter